MINERVTRYVPTQCVYLQEVEFYLFVKNYYRIYT